MPTRTRNAAIKAISKISAAEIESRLTEIEAEAQALRSLLRSLKARDRAREQAACG